MFDTTYLPLAACRSDWNTSVDTRDAVRGLPATQALVDAVAAVLQLDLTPALQSIDNPSSRHFRLAISSLVATINVSFSALLSDQRSISNSHNTFMLYLYFTAWHFIVLHPKAFSVVWK